MDDMFSRPPRRVPHHSRSDRNGRRPSIGAKQKLNVAHFGGALVLAGIAGGATESIAVFIVVMVTVLVMSLRTGDIRR